MRTGRTGHTRLTGTGLLCDGPHDLWGEIGELVVTEHAHGGTAGCEHGDTDAIVESDGVGGEEGMRDALSM